MRVFISWAKPLAQEVARLLYDWIPHVIQAVTPWLSSEDVAKGVRWFDVLSSELNETSQAIVCVTRENLQEAWLHFEAGAIAKSVGEARVRPVLYDLTPTDLTGPLAEFQATALNDREDMRRLVCSLNESLSDPLRQDILDQAFDRNWENLVSSLDAMSGQSPMNEHETIRSEKDLLVEILERVRAGQRSGHTRSPLIREVMARMRHPSRVHRFRNAHFEERMIVLHHLHGLGKVEEVYDHGAIIFFEEEDGWRAVGAEEAIIPLD